MPRRCNTELSLHAVTGKAIVCNARVLHDLGSSHVRLYMKLRCNVRSSTQAVNATAGGNGTQPEEPPTMVVQRERRRTIRVPLKIGGPGFVLPGTSEAQRAVGSLQRGTKSIKSDFRCCTIQMLYVCRAACGPSTCLVLRSLP